MNSRRRVASTDAGQILDRQRLIGQDDHKITYDEFLKEMQVYTENEEKIISELTNTVRNRFEREAFDQLVLNFKGKDSLIRNCMADLNKQMKKLRDEISEADKISEAAQCQAKSYATELKKLELSNLETFKWLLGEELKNENFRKEEALKEFMAECVNNEVVAESPDT